MRITFDKGTANERSLKVDRINENPVDLVMNGYFDTIVEKPEDFPDISPFIEKPDFDSIEVVTEDEMVVPICAGYNHIESITATYYEKGKSYTLNVQVVRRERTVEEAEA